MLETRCGIDSKPNFDTLHFILEASRLTKTQNIEDTQLYTSR